MCTCKLAIKQITHTGPKEGRDINRVVSAVDYRTLLAPLMTVRRMAPPSMLYGPVRPIRVLQRESAVSRIECGDPPVPEGISSLKTRGLRELVRAARPILKSVLPTFPPLPPPSSPPSLASSLLGSGVSVEACLDDAGQAELSQTESHP